MTTVVSIVRSAGKRGHATNLVKLEKGSCAIVAYPDDRDVVAQPSRVVREHREANTVDREPCNQGRQVENVRHMDDLDKVPQDYLVHALNEVDQVGLARGRGDVGRFEVLAAIQGSNLHKGLSMWLTP